MGLLETGLVKQVIGNTQAVLTAAANESFRIRDVRISTPSGNYATFATDKTTVGYWRVGNTGAAKLGNHLPFPKKLEEASTLMSWLLDRGIMRPYPVATGESFTITGVHQATSVVQIIYDRYEAGDVSSEEPNGSSAKEYDFMMYGTPTATGVMVAGENAITEATNPSEFHPFPFEKSARPNVVTTIFGIAFSGLGAKTSLGESRTTYLKIVKDRVVLKDEDKNGLMYLGSVPAAASNENIGAGQDLAGNYSDIDERLPLIFVDPLVFQPGEELTTNVVAAVVSTAMSMSCTGMEVGYMIREVGQ